MALVDLTPEEEAIFTPKNLSTLEADNNTIYDEENDRVLSLPQGLSGSETGFVIKRDIDGVKNFFAQEDVGDNPNLFSSFAKGAFTNTILTIPQFAGGLIKEQGEALKQRQQDMQSLSITERNRKNPPSAFDVIGLGNVSTWVGDQVIKNINADEIVSAADQLIERNKKYIAQSGWTLDENATPLNRFMYDLGGGGGSLLTSIGLTALTRNPVAASVYFGAIAKSSAYQEARDAGADPQFSSDISSVAGIIEGGLEMVGLDFFFKGLKGNTAVKRFVNGFVVEAIQEGSQQAGNEIVTQATGIRKKTAQETAKDILYSAALGGIIGGGSSSTIGAFIKDEAESRGLDKKTANQLAKYAEENLDSAKQDMTEFIAKEVAPIAADNESAQKFMQIMQQFGNDQLDVKREALDPAQQEAFDQYIEIFNNSARDKSGIAEAEKQFFDQAVTAGIDEEQAVAASKLIGARADAASRALGITPKQWLDMQKIELKVSEQQSTADALNDEILYQKDGTIKTETPEFKNWFGDSKVVDTDGKPLVVYHGTNAEFDAFSTEKFGSGVGDEGGASGGFFFTSDQKTANIYAGEATFSNDRIAYDAGNRGALIPSYLRIENPLRVEYGESRSADVVRRAQEKGYDGIIDERGDYVVFSPTQIKSVNNRGTFDPNDPRILYQKARGSIEFQGDKTIISLFKEANASTLLHELGHLFLRDMRAVSKATIRPRVKADYDAVKKWLGAKGDTLTVAQEEKFARGFEAYLREGKAPRPELQSVFDKFKQWLTDIYKSVRDLNVTISPEIRQVFDRMLGGDFALSEKLLQEEAVANEAADYERIRTMEPEKERAFRNGIALQNDFAADLFVPVSTRLGKINEGIKHAVRKFSFNTGYYSHKDRMGIEGFVKKASKMEVADYREFDLALKNRDSKRVDALLDKYDMQKEWSKVRDILDGLYNRAKEVGLDISYIEEYFPRKVKRDKAGDYLATMRSLPEWGEIQLALNEIDPDGTLDLEEKAAFVNQFLRGFVSNKVNLSRSSFTKERRVDYIKPEWNKFYQDSNQTLIDYVSTMNKGIEARRLFGKSEKETDKNIGQYVLTLVDQGLIKPEQEKELKKILKAVVEPRGPGEYVTLLKDTGYIMTMGSPISAITQLKDLQFSLYKNGYFNTIGSFAKSLSGRSVLTPQELGIENILQEFEGHSRASSTVRAVFKAVGLTYMDNIGKKTFIDAAYNRLAKLSAKNDKAFNDQLDVIFAEEAGQVKQDLANGTMSENVKYLLFSELADFQPIALSEMPLNYLNSGNGRIFYMLKSYTVRQLDIYRREIFSKLASGNPKQVAEGFGNMLRLGITMMLMGIPVDMLKDFILGRDFDIGDLALDNILQVMGFSKFQIYKSRQEGIGRTILTTLFIPPIGPAVFVDDAQRDAAKLAQGKRELKDLDIFQRVPLVGKFYYWWFGGGHEKEEKKKNK